MNFKAQVLRITAGGRRIALLAEESANTLGVHSSDRIRVTYGNQQLIAIVNIAAKFPKNSIGLYEETAQAMGLKGGETVNVDVARVPESLAHIRAKIRGERLRDAQVMSIVKDVVEHHLSEVETAAFLTALEIHGLSLGENEALCRAMVETGKTVHFNRTPILDKHSIGGLPGDKTSILVVPIVAAAGFTIPKTSSRAVTSTAGTADRIEVLCPVNLTVKEIHEVVEKTNGCLVWGGALELAPADDLFIQIEYPLGIDPLLLPSIMSKKKAIGATDVVIDIPVGSNAKVKTLTEAYNLSSDFIDLGKRLGINVNCALTNGDQPLGYAIGPALEAREALCALRGDGPSDLKEKAVTIASMLLEMVGVQNAKATASGILRSGKADRKLREILAAQGGNPDVIPEDIPVGPKKTEVTATQKGRVQWISAESLVQIARAAGAPKEKGAGIVLKKKLGEAAAAGTVLMEIYAEHSIKLQAAEELAEKLQPIALSRRIGERMLLDQVPAKTTRVSPFMLER